MLTTGATTVSTFGGLAARTETTAMGVRVMTRPTMIDG